MNFHVNPKTGNSGACRAVKGNCPFGNEAEHFPSKEEAQKHYEKGKKKLSNFSGKLKYHPLKAPTY